jgi:hypothetical protein
MSFLRIQKQLALIIALGSLAIQAGATPSTTYWTPCVIDFQGYKVGHITYDNYTTLGKRPPDAGSFPNDLGLTVGVLPFDKLQAEVGFDWMEPTDFPLSFNAKIGAPEGALFKGAPALEVGLVNFGVKKNVTDQNIVDFITGRSLPGGLGRVHLGAYVGNSRVLRNSSGDRADKGYMVAYDYGFMSTKGPNGDFNRLVLAGDYASGRNAFGGGGGGLYYYFTKDISLLGGPVWFNDTGINGQWKWTTQLDVNF